MAKKTVNKNWYQMLYNVYEGKTKKSFAGLTQDFVFTFNIKPHGDIDNEVGFCFWMDSSVSFKQLVLFYNDNFKLISELFKELEKLFKEDVKEGNLKLEFKEVEGEQPIIQFQKRNEMGDVNLKATKCYMIKSLEAKPSKEETYHQEYSPVVSEATKYLTNIDKKRICEIKFRNMLIECLAEYLNNKNVTNKKDVLIKEYVENFCETTKVKETTDKFAGAISEFNVCVEGFLAEVVKTMQTENV